MLVPRRRPLLCEGRRLERNDGGFGVRSKVVATADEAVAGVPDGATIMFGGFVSAGTPTNLIRALVRRGVRGITGIANNIGLGDELDTLNEGRQLAKFIASFAIRATG